MTALNDDDVIEKPSDLGYYFLFLKDLIQYCIHTKFHNQGITGSGFMIGGSLTPWAIR